MISHLYIIRIQILHASQCIGLVQLIASRLLVQYLWLYVSVSVRCSSSFGKEKYFLVLALGSTVLS
jgi:hypothetical protein